jgi:hypothetical protein
VASSGKTNYTSHSLFFTVTALFMTQLFSRRATLSILTLVTFGFAACGGGGGGGESFVGAANVQVDTSPSRIDSGDRTQLRIRLSDVHENGIALKIRFPSGLRYVPASSFLMVDEKEIDLSPTINQTVESEDVTYLVFYLTQSQFRRSSQEYNGEEGVFTAQLEGRRTVIDGEIEVDPDVDDPDEDNQLEFDVNNPEFVSEGSASIEVIAE